LICLFSQSYSETNSISSVEKLSPALRGLLKQEMLAIEQGMKDIVPAYTSGDLPAVANIAEKIKKSYILKKEISKTQKHELHTKLPKDFITKDKQFHQYAAMLEHVSNEKHSELVVFYYSKLLESCISCHAEYAVHRFPSLSASPTMNEHHH
jgi:hypothetical protein